VDVLSHIFGTKTGMVWEFFDEKNVFAKSYEELTNLTDGFSSAFHTILLNFRQEKV
jgi:hypothetical protein